MNKPQQSAVMTEQLANGLRVKLVPMAGFQQTFAMINVNVGSVDTRFQANGGHVLTVPAGTAHYLEHKLFEKKDYDAFDLFGRLGADSNAFTDLCETSYLFSTTTNLHQCLTTLLNFVQEPYFTQEKVDKERGIIGEEIKMYDDQTGMRLYDAMVANLYPHTPLAEDIAGSLASIQQIRPQDLQLLYDYFYQPANMTLLVVGGFDPQQVLAWVQENQQVKHFAPHYQRPTSLILNSQQRVVKQWQQQMDVKRPRVMIGLRGQHDWPAADRLKYQLAGELFFSLLFDESSSNFLRLYNAGIIDDSFGYETEVANQFDYACLGSVTDQPAKFRDEIYRILLDSDHQLARATAQFDNVKKSLLGRLIGMMDSPEAVANRFAEVANGDWLVVDEVNTLRSLTIDDLGMIVDSLIKPEQWTTCQIVPGG